MSRVAHTTNGGIESGGESIPGQGVTSRLLDAAFLRDLDQIAAGRKRVLRSLGEKSRSGRRNVTEPVSAWNPAVGHRKGSTPISFALGDNGRSNSADAELRLEQLFHKLFAEENDLSIHLILDGTQSMGYSGMSGFPTKFSYARKMAAALGYVALARYGHVGISTLGHARGRRTPILKGEKAAGQLFSYLENLSPGGYRDFSRAALGYAQRVAEQPGVCIIFSDFLDSHWERAIRSLFARRFQVVLVQILDPEESAPTHLEEFHLVDKDTGSSRPVAATRQVLARYRTALNHFCSQLSDAAGYQGMGYLRTTTETKFEDALLRALKE